MSQIIITRSAAFSQGLTKYYTGRPCKRGHLVSRYTITAACTTCLSESRKQDRRRMMECRVGESYGLKPITVSLNPLDFEVLRDIVDIINAWRRNPSSDTKLRMLGAYVQALKFE